MSLIADNHKTVITPDGHVGFLQEFENKKDSVVTFNDIYKVDRSDVVDVDKPLPKDATDEQKQRYRGYNQP